jgi:phage terminase large subunit
MLHWLYTFFVQKDLDQEVLDALIEAGFAADPSALLSWNRVSTIENRHNLNPLYYAMLLATYKGLWREQELEGRFVSFEGLVYPNWQPDRHEVPKSTFKIQEWWPKWRVIDFGYKNPFVCQWWTRNPEGEYIMYREIYYTRRTVAQHAKQINRLSKNDGNIRDTICDHDAEDRATLEENGIPNIPAKKAITLGIQNVERLLGVDESDRPDVFYLKGALVEKDPMLVAEELPTCTVEEYPRYSWPQDQDGKARKEIPIDLHNHGMDASRYFFAEVEGLNEDFMEFGKNPVKDYRG